MIFESQAMIGAETEFGKPTYVPFVFLTEQIESIIFIDKLHCNICMKSGESYLIRTPFTDMYDSWRMSMNSFQMEQILKS